MSGWARKRRRVRLHMINQEPSIEGFLIGRVNGHYRIEEAEYLEARGRTHALDGVVMVPRDRVNFYQELPS